MISNISSLQNSNNANNKFTYRLSHLIKLDRFQLAEYSYHLNCYHVLKSIPLSRYRSSSLGLAVFCAFLCSCQ